MSSNPKRGLNVDSYVDSPGSFRPVENGARIGTAQPQSYDLSFLIPEEAGRGCIASLYSLLNHGSGSLPEGDPAVAQVGKVGQSHAALN